MTLFDALTVEILFDGVSWVDVSSRVDRGSVEIRQARPDPYTDIAAGALSLTLSNTDGYLMPDSTVSPYYPNVAEQRQIRVKLRRGATTYTRFWGYVTDWIPSFPGTSTTSAVVAVKALDTLSILARKNMYSAWVEGARNNAILVSTRADMFILKGDGTATQYFDNVTTSTGTKMRATTVAASNTQGPLTFGDAEGLSVDGAATLAPASDHTGTVIKMEALGHRCVQFWVRIPSEQQVDGTTTSLEVCSFWDATNSTTYGSIRLTNNVGTTDLAWYNAAGAFVAQIAFGVTENHWVRLSLLTKTATPTTTDVYYDGGTPGFLNVALDLRNVRHMWFGGRGTLVPKMSIAGPVLLGLEGAAVQTIQGLSAGTPWTVDGRMAFLDAAVHTPAIINVGTTGASTSALTGNWHGRTALAIAHEIARTARGVFWARSRDSTPLHIEADATYPATPVITATLELDTLGAPQLARDVATRATRVTVTYPGGKALVVDAAAEASIGQENPGKQIDTVAASFTDAETLGNASLAKGAAGLRIRRVTLDLETCVNDPIAVLFDESTTLGGLFPTQRVRLAGLDPAFFSGSTIRDVYVEGWTERYSPDESALEMECSAALMMGSYPSSYTYPSSSTYPGA